MILTNSLIIGLAIGISIIIITGAPFQASTNHYEKDSIFSMNSNTKFAFAQTGGEVNGGTESQLPEESSEEPSQEPTPPAEEPTPPAEEPTPPAEEPTPHGNATPPSPPPPGNATPSQELPKVENASQAISGVADKDKDKELEKHLDKTRDERVDRHICVHSPYYGDWNYDSRECKIDDPELKKEYEKEQKENSRFDKLICPRYGGEWNEGQKKCMIEDDEERTAYEDYLCDDPADTILYCDPSFAQTPSEQITEYDKNQCIHVFDGKWNEKTLSCETENPDYQKYLKERHDIYFCISLDGKWNDQKNTCETKPPRPPNGDHDRRDHDDSKRHYKEVIKIINNNVIIVRGFDNLEREIFVIGDANTCPAQNSTVTLSGKINPKEIRLLGDFYPCYIEDGSVILNIPDTHGITPTWPIIPK